MRSHLLLAATLLAAAFLPATSAAGEPAPEISEAEIHVYSALGTPRRFTVRGRVLKESPEAGKRSGAVSRNLRRLFDTEEWKHAALELTAAGQKRNVSADEEGRFEAVFELEGEEIAPGAHPLSVVGPHGLRAESTLTILGPGSLVVVSDFDDTVAVSEVTSKTKMLGVALAKDSDTQQAAPGMAALYGCLAEQGAHFVYLSGSPVQFFPRLRAFLDKNGFPPGSMELRKLGEDPLDGQAFKTPRLARLLAELPESRFVFVGDSGEKDPEVYRGARAAAGARLAATFVRLVTDEPADSPRFEGMRAFRDPAAAVPDAAARGLVAPACAARLLPPPR